MPGPPPDWNNRVTNVTQVSTSAAGGDEVGTRIVSGRGLVAALQKDSRSLLTVVGIVQSDDLRRQLAECANRLQEQVAASAAMTAEGRLGAMDALAFAARSRDLLWTVLAAMNKASSDLAILLEVATARQLDPVTWAKLQASRNWLEERETRTRIKVSKKRQGTPRKKAAISPGDKRLALRNMSRDQVARYKEQHPVAASQPVVMSAKRQAQRDLQQLEAKLRARRDVQQLEARPPASESPPTPNEEQP